MPPAKLSVNINKYALLRNSRGAGRPDLLDAIDLCLEAGAHGITVHPRLDQRHIRFEDVPAIAAHLRSRWPGVEYNVECEDDADLIKMVQEVRPDQCTLVPVTPGEVTSDHGWSLPEQAERLQPSIDRLHETGIRVSLFADPVPRDMPRFAEVGADRIEIYTGPYAWAWSTAEAAAQTNLVRATAEAATAAGLGVNAGHDLDRHNLQGIAGLPELQEVSIGHAHICRALLVGTNASIRELLAALGWGITA